MTIQTVTYEAVRPHLQSGDCILWQSCGILPRLIRLWSDYSHASLVVVDPDGRVCLAESNPCGPERTFLSARLGRDKSSRVFLLRPRGLNELKSFCCRRKALDLCESGRPYPVLDLLLNAFRRREMGGDLFCSEMVWQVWLGCGLVKPHLVDGRSLAPRPGDLPEWSGGEVLEVIRG